MACQFESKIFELDDLSEADRALAQEHLTQCAECRELSGQLTEVDARLQRAIRVPSLSPQFAMRLREAVALIPLTESERAQKKQEAEMEFRAELARLRRSTWSVLQILDGIGWAALAFVAGWLVSIGLGALGKTYPVGEIGWIVGTGVLALLLFAVGLALTFTSWTRYLWGDE